MKNSLSTSLSPEPGLEETPSWREQLDRGTPSPVRSGIDQRGRTGTKGVQRERREDILEEGAFEGWIGVPKERRHSVCCCPEAKALTGGL